MAAGRLVSVGALSAMLLATGACDEESLPDDPIMLRDQEMNGVRLNGVRLNGVRLNGVRLNGDQLDGDSGTGDYIKTLGIDLHGSSSGTDSWLEASDLFIASSAGPVLSGAALKKTVIEFDVKETGKGKKFKTVKIVDVGLLAAGSDIKVYSLDLKDGGGWGSLCEGNQQVIMLGDVWDPSTGARIEGLPDDAVTFACRGAALAKCVEFGYRPWATVNGVSLRDHHQACTRMVRADYCGDGVAHTSDGTPIHVLDPLGIQSEDPDVDYLVEAEWGPDGATCLNLANTRHPNQVLGCDIPTCGESFSSGGLIQSGTVLSL